MRFMVKIVEDHIDDDSGDEEEISRDVSDVDKMTKKMGIYENDQDGEHPQEVGIAEELEKNIES